VGASGIASGFPLKADMHTGDTFHSQGQCKAQETDQLSNTVVIALKPSYPIFLLKIQLIYLRGAENFLWRQTGVERVYSKWVWRNFNHHWRAGGFCNQRAVVFAV